MTNKNAETARLRSAHVQTMLALGILGLIAVLAAVGMLLGNDKAPTILSAVLPCSDMFSAHAKSVFD